MAFAGLVVATGCGDANSSAPADGPSPNGVKVLSRPATESAEKTTPPLPDEAIWTTPLGDPFLESGRVVWTGTCIQCHSIGLGGAPLIGNRALWGPRIEKGLDVLVEHAQRGFYGDVGEMPARGDNQALSDEEIRAAVHFMATRAM